MQTNRPWRRTMGIALGAVGTLLAASCGPQQLGAGSPGDDGYVPSGRVHIMPVRGAERKVEAAPAGAHLTYYGGPVIQNVKVWTVFWGAGVQFTSQLNSFYGAVTNSAHFDWLSEYNTSSPAQSIGRGTLGGTIVDSTPPAGKTISDAQIQGELQKLITAGKLPPNDGNNLYMVHFPPGITITQGGNSSCSYFCAYHGTFNGSNGKYAYYGVIPDQGGACAGGCGTDPSQFNNTTSTASHELIEAVTDAAVGLATANAAPLAWYDSTNGEIGDICNGQQGTVAGYVVQKEWSNKANACIVTNGTTCTPSCTGKSCGSDGCGGSCGACPSGQTCNPSGQCVAGCTPSCTGKSCGSDGCGGSCGTCPSGSTCNGSGQCVASGGGCAHPICTAGTKLASGCDPCATKICASDSYCCSTQWDSQCVGEVASICGQSCSTCTPACTGKTCGSDGCGGSCGTCATGQTCNSSGQCVGGTCTPACTGKQCGSDGCGGSCGTCAAGSTCSATGQCVSSSGTCSHSICAAGPKLKKSCDPCVTKICNADSYCCGFAWDSQCVSEVASICGKTC